MSRGHGVRQLKILASVSKAGNSGVYIVPRNATPSESASIRRAAYKLEVSGEIALRTHKGRLVAFAPDAERIPEDRVEIGKDGRLYRSPYGMSRDQALDQFEWEAVLERYDSIADMHGHPHGPGILMCYECAESAGATSDVLAKIRAANEG